MKSLLVLALAIFSFTANATTYYVSNAGNDSNSGTSTDASWQTLSKVNSASFSPGDNILFKRGDTFYGTITIKQSGSAGNPITFGAFGTGNNPVITGFTNVSSWINLGSNIWESTSAVSSLSTCNMVAINGINTPMGRYPNSGYLTYSSVTSTSLTSSSLNAATTNWTGAEAVIKKERYIIDRSTIISSSGTTINYSSSSYTGYAGWGFFIQNDVRTLDTANEWYYNPSTKKIRIYSTSQPTGVQVSSLANLIYATNNNYIVIDGFSFTGANADAFYLGNFSNSTIQNCSFDFNYNGIGGYQYGGSSANLIINNCAINHTNNNGISLPSEFAGATITGNVIKNSGLIAGMSGSGDGQAQGVNIMGDNYLIQSNEIDSTGYVALGFNGSNVLCKNNFVNYFCITKDDGGGIYTGQAHSGVVISYNIVLNGIGCDDGIGSTNSGRASGIYLDVNPSGMQLLNNSIANVIYAGIFLHSAKDIEVRSNTTYNCGIGLLVDEDDVAIYTTGLTVKRNIFLANTTGEVFSPQDQKTIVFATAHTTGNAIAGFGSAGSIDSNYYARPINDSLTIRGTIYAVADNDYSLASWQSYSGFDTHTQKSPKAITDVNDLLFEYNATTSSVIVPLDANYIDVTGKSYNGSITLAPYSSAVLIKNGALSKNQPPTANAGYDQTITLPSNGINLSGSGEDSDGSISSYSWSKISGPSSGTIKDSNSASTTVSGLTQGLYQFQLTVTDNQGGVGKDTVSVTVNAAANIPPTANAGTGRSITLPINTTSLSGSGSDADGTISSYSWTKISGPSLYNIVNPSSPVTDVSGLTQGLYQFQLTVIDNNGATGASTVQVTVNAANNIPPTANAGSNKTITLPTNTTSLSGSGSDADGTISSYSWTKISGPSAYNIVNPSSPVTDVSGLVQGLYQFQLTVTDNKGATGTSTVLITVNATNNIPPTANAGSDKTITLPTNTTSLSGSGSSVTGTITSYSWTKISGPSAYNIVNPSSSVTDVSGLVQGLYQFQLTVTDNNGATGTSTVQVTVNPANNIPPTADAGSDKTITLPTNTTSLSGSGSGGTGTIASYNWTKISGPSAYNIVNPSSPVTDVSGLTQGLYQFQLTVTDNKGATGTSTVLITVNATNNIPPTANAGSNTTITLPTSTTSLSGSGSDADGTISSYNWTKISGPSAYNIVNPSSPVTDVSGLTQGLYQFQLTVTDNNGATGTSTVQVTVNAANNIAPTADAGSDKTITLPTNTTSLSGSGSGGTGTIASYNWTKISGPSAYNIVNPSSPVTDVSGLTQGLYQFQLTVTDNNGAIGTSTVQVIVVNPANNIPPTADAGSDKTITLPTNTTSLSGSGSDADGTISSYSWTKISGPSAYNIVNSSSPVTDVSGLVQGVYQFELTVTDNEGAIGKATVSITVNKGLTTTTVTSPNIAPIANAGSDTTVVAPIQFVTLNGSGTGGIISYLWNQISGPSTSTISSNNAAVTNVSNLVEGTYEFELTVTDNAGAKGKDTVKVIVALGRLARETSILKVYPNPVHDIATLEINTGKDNTNLMIMISDISGKTVYRKGFVSGISNVKESINMSNLIKGTYVITVLFDGMEKQSVKVVRL